MFHHIRIISSIIALIAVVLISPGGGHLAAYAGQPDRDHDSIPDMAEQILGTNPNTPDTDGDSINDVDDQDPVFAENPIVNTATEEGFKIVEALVENNFDPVAKKDADDHLEITVENTAGSDLSGFECYYTIRDVETDQQEGYYVKLPELVVKSGESATIHFDNRNGQNHVGENENSIYRSSENAKIFEVTLSVPGYAPVTVHIEKDAGGAEEAD